MVTRASTPTQWNFKAYYLYGAVAPQTGESFWLEFSHLDGMCFQMFLDQLAQKYPAHLNQQSGQIFGRSSFERAVF